MCFKCDAQYERTSKIQSICNCLGLAHATQMWLTAGSAATQPNCERGLLEMSFWSNCRPKGPNPKSDSLQDMSNSLPNCKIDFMAMVSTLVAMPSGQKLLGVNMEIWSCQFTTHLRFSTNLATIRTPPDWCFRHVSLSSVSMVGACAAFCRERRLDGH